MFFSEELLQIKYERVNASKNTIQMFEKFAEKESIFLKIHKTKNKELKIPIFENQCPK